MTRHVARHTAAHCDRLERLAKWRAFLERGLLAELFFVKLVIDENHDPKREAGKIPVLINR